MQWNPEEITRFENIVTQLAGEIHLTKPKSDEGLLPIFSLVSELSDDFASDPCIAELSKRIQVALQPMLDEAKLFEEPAIETLKTLSVQLSNTVKVALRPEEEMMAKIQGNKEVLNLRGKVIPLFRLHDHFKIPGAETDPTNATIVVVETAGRPYGLLVDEMVSKQEVVIKSLGRVMQGVKGVSGGAILGDGNIALILDPASLINAA